MTRILYFVTDKAPVSVRLALESKNNEVGICLMQDAVYLGCKEKNGILAEAIKHGILVFAAKRDVELRGLLKFIYPEVRVLDYSEIIDLVLDYERVVNI